MREDIKKSIKRWLKRKVTITLGMMVAFMITGGVVYSNDGLINQEVTIKAENGTILVTPEGAGVLDGNTWTNNGKIDVAWGNGVRIDSSVTQNFSLINNGVITGSNSPDDYSGNGIYNNGTIETLTNSGVISGNSSGSGYYSGNGIYNNGTIKTLTNNGIISGKKSNDYSTVNIGNGIYNNGTIETLTNSGLIKGNSNNSGFGSGNGIYNESGTIESLTNNGIITGTTKLGMNNGNGNGIFNWKGTIESLINNGIISGNSNSGNSYSEANSGNGIYNESGTITTLTNSGLIKGNSNNSEYFSGNGIFNERYETIEILINNGIITGTTKLGINNRNGNGIYNESGTIITLTNSGLIKGNSNNSEFGSGIGIYNESGTIGSLTNNGTITGNSYSGSSSSGNYSGNGIYNEIYGTIETLTNNGTITGNSYSGTSNGNGIYNERYGTIGSLTNYGIIAGSNKAINNQGTITTQNNYGLLIDGAGTDNVTVNAGAGGEITEEGEYKGYTVKNTFVDTNNQYQNLTSITETDITLSTDSEKLIINGYKKGLKVNKDLTLSNSIINSYTTAINIESGNFTGNNIIINGGIDETSATIKGNANTDNLTLTNNSIINGNIDMGSGADTISLTSSTLNGGVIATDDNITMDKSDINGNSTLTDSEMTLTSTTLNGNIIANGGKINITGSNNLFNVGASTINGNITIENGEIYVKDGSIINGNITLDGTTTTVWLDKNQAINGKITIDESVTEKFLGVNYNINTDEDMTSLKNQTDKFTSFDVKLKDGENTVTLTDLNINSITGGNGADNFKTTIAGLVGKTIVGVGNDTLTLLDNITTGNTIDFSNIKNVENLQLADGGNTLNISNSSFPIIRGGNGDDNFKIYITGLVGKAVYGGEGSDTLTLLDNITTENQGSISFFRTKSIENLQLADGGNTFDISNSHIKNILGGSGVDTFQTSIDKLNDKTIVGGAGSDVLEIISGVFDNTENNILENVTEVEELKLANANNKVDIDKLTGFNKVVGNDGADNFKTTIDALSGKALVGGEGNDVLEITSGAFDNTTSNPFTSVTGVEELKLANANNKVNIDKFIDFNKVVGNDGIDTFIGNDKDKFINMTLDGGNGEDNLQLGFTADNSNIFTNVSNIENLTLTASNNNLIFNGENDKFDNISFGKDSTDNTISLTDVDTSISFATSGNNVVNLTDSDYRLSNHISGANTINLQGDKEWSFEGSNIIGGKDVNINSSSGVNLGITYDGVIKVNDSFITDNSNAILNGEVKISFDGVKGITFDSIDNTHTLSFGKLSLGDSSKLYIPAFLSSQKNNSNDYTLSVKKWNELVGNSSLDIYTDRYNTAITKYNQEGYLNLTTAFNNFSKDSIVDYITDDNELGSKLTYTSENKTYDTRVFKDGETILINGGDSNLTFNDIVVTGIDVAVENGNNTLTLGGTEESSINVGTEGINADNSKVALTLNISGEKNNNISSISMKNSNNNTINLKGNNITVGDIAFGSGDNNLVIDKLSNITSVGEISSTSGDKTNSNKITISNAIQKEESEKLLNLLNQTQNSIGSINLTSESKFVVNSQYNYDRDINLTSNNSITLEENGVLKADNIKFNGNSNQVTVNGGDIDGTLTFGEGSGDILTVNTGDRLTYKVVGADTINLGNNGVWSFADGSSILSNSNVNIFTGEGYVKMEIGKDGQISSYNPFQNGTTAKIDNLKFTLDSSVIFDNINETITLDTNIMSDNLMVSDFLTNNNGTLSIKKAGELGIGTLYQGNYEYLVTNYYNRDKDENGVITGIFNDGSAEDIKNKVENMITEEQHFYSFKGEVDTKLSLSKIYIETTSDESVADKNNDIVFNDFATTDDFIVNVDKGTENSISILGNVTLGKGIDASQSEGKINLTLGGGEISKNNMNITLGKSDDILNILSDISATLDGNTGNNILNIGKIAQEKSDTSKDTITLAGEIKNFSEFNLYQNTKLDSGLKLSMNGSDKKINLNKNDLILGIDYEKKDEDGKVIGHALYDNGITVNNNDGNLIVEASTASKNSIISMGKENASVIENGENIFLSGSANHNVTYDRDNNEINVTIKEHIIGENEAVKYAHLDRIYQSIVDANKIGLMAPSSTLTDKTEDEAIKAQLEFYGKIYNSTPYAYSNDISRETANMVNDSIMDSRFKADEGSWLHYGAIAGQGYDDDNSYYGRGYYNSVDLGIAEVDIESDIYSAYYMGEYGKTDKLALGYVIAGNNSNTDIGESDLKGSGYYLGAYTKYSAGNLRLIAGLGYQHNYYKADRRVSNKYQLMTIWKKYTDDTLTAYSGVKYIHNLTDDLTFEPYARVSLAQVMQHSINEADNGDLSISVDGKGFTTLDSEIGVDLVKSTVVKDGKVNLIAGVGAEIMLDGYGRENLTAKVNGSSKTFDIISEKEENFRGKVSLGVEYEKTNGVFYNAKGSYIRTEDNDNCNLGIGIGYKF
ncbi:Uncharacterised protein [Fusobacterium necrogenes]|uniref:Autotransporter domain-containing protein n=1 Tax=Fusobacterium necrogenes TaxID=858 RepID=A0A377GWZ9_9FUSO|nr:autotransporter outer membrane beta-barrel domain-containing protein [Fusobacterium necrogenes]STO31081.1 Uncharacterised protein [Fusobacterium necrogenes]